MLEKEFDLDDFFRKMNEIEAEVTKEVEELFNDELSVKEFDIAMNPRMDIREKRAKLAMIRAERQVKPKSFEQRMTPAGHIHAEGLGIKLD